MVPLKAPAPFSGLRRLAEDADEVPVRIADHRPLLLGLLENALQAHDRSGLVVAGLARPGFQKFQRDLLLLVVQLLETQALAGGGARLIVLLRREEPFDAV